MIRDTSVKGDVRYTKSICQKKCTRQSLKVLWVVFSSLFFIEIWKNGMRGHGRMFVTAAKWKQQKWIRQQQSWGKVYRSYPILPFGTVAWTFFRQPFSKWLHYRPLSRAAILSQESYARLASLRERGYPFKYKAFLISLEKMVAAWQTSIV